MSNNSIGTTVRLKKVHEILRITQRFRLIALLVRVGATKISLRLLLFSLAVPIYVSQRSRILVFCLLVLVFV